MLPLLTKLHQMRLRTLLLGAALATGIQANAQWVADSVITGPGYTNDGYYSLKNGNVSAAANTNWHLGFQITPQGPNGNASIFANHVMGKVSVYSLHMKASTSFTTLAAGDTVGKTSSSMALLNSDTTWNRGAFNQLNNPSDPFDFGWGEYNITTHDLNGDSLFLVKIDTATYKLWVQSYHSAPSDSIRWGFRIAKFDGSNDTTVVVPRHAGGYDFTSRLFAYYNATTKTILDREPGRYDWDLLFTRYMDTASQGPIFLTQPVAGVFSNFGVSVAEAHNIDPDTANYQNYARGKKLNEIGYDWKHYDQPNNQWLIDNTTYFIKTTNTGEYYVLQFTAFGGATTGKYVFRKKYLAPTSVKNINTAVNAYSISPNPAQNTANVMIDAAERADNAKMIITDITGKTVQQYSFAIQKGVNGYSLNTASLPAGVYMVLITNGSWKLTDKLLVQH